MSDGLLAAFGRLLSGWFGGVPLPMAPGGVPGPPTGVTASPGRAQAVVTWTPPSSNGGSPITGYTVTSSPGAKTASVGGSTTTATVTGLTNNTAYTFTVVASNANGKGPASAPSNSVTPKSTLNAPTAPINPTATAGNAQATVSWTRPSSDGGSLIISYTVTSSPGSKTASVSGTTTTATVTGLTNGTSYTFTVKAGNGVGSSPASTASNAVTPQVPPPGPPTGVSAVGGNARATVFWTPPVPNGGSPITGYIATASLGGKSSLVGATATQATVTALSNGTQYTFTVVATSAIGNGPASSPSGGVTPAAPSVTPLACTAAGWGYVPGATVTAGETVRWATSTSPSDVWAVGSKNNGSGVNVPLATHWDGRQWSLVSMPTAGDHSDLYGVSSSLASDSWAVGEFSSGGTPFSFVLHWDGTSWSRSGVSVAASRHGLRGVAAISPTDVWAIGYTGGGLAPFQSLAIHWDGSQWSSVPTPNPSSTRDSLLDVTAISTNDVWALGLYDDTSGVSHGFTLHWDGNLWNQVSLPDPPGGLPSSYGGIAAVSTNDVWMAGAAQPTGLPGAVPMTAHWNGAQWSYITTPNPGLPQGNALQTIFTIGTNNVWAGGTASDNNGSHSIVMHWDGAQWVLVPVSTRSSVFNGTVNYSGGLVAGTGTASGESWMFTAYNTPFDTEQYTCTPAPPEVVGGGNPNEAKCSCQSTANPVDNATGDFWHTFVDLTIPGRGIAISLARTYNSLSAGRVGRFGYGWTDVYNVSLAIDPTGFVTVIQGNGSVVTFAQQSDGSYRPPSRVLAKLVKNPDGTYTMTNRDQTRNAFDSSGRLIKQIDLNGYVTSLAYDGSGQLATITDPAGRTLTVVFTNGFVSSVSDQSGRSVLYQYDAQGNLSQTTDMAGGVTTYGYDTNHLLQIIRDALCTSTTGCTGLVNVYDTSGRVASQTDAMNRRFTFTYVGNQTTVTDPKGNVTVETYQGNEVVSRTRGYGTAQAATSGYQYDPSSLGMTTVTDPDNHPVTNTYDPGGNLLTRVDSLNRKTTYTYNGFNEVLTATDPLNVTTTNSYDANGNLTTLSRPLVGTSQAAQNIFTFGDSAHPGDATQMTDADGKVWAYTYDSNGYRNSVTDPLGNTTTSSYDSIGRLISSTSPKGNVAGCNCAAQYTTTFAYNPFGQLTTKTDPNHQTAVRHYDANQNMDSVRDGNGNLTTYAYDLDNEQVQAKRADTPQTSLTTDFNPDGTVLDQKDGKNNLIIANTYDSLARLSSSTDALGNVTGFSYDAASNRMSKQDAGGNCSSTPAVGCTKFTYDAANQLKTVTYSDGLTPNVTNINYDAAGQRTGLTDGTGTSTWVWDSLHRLTSYTNGGGAQVQYAYNLRNLDTTITYPANLNVTRGYDDAGRLASVQDWLGNTTSFVYDPNSNVITESLPSTTQVVDTFTFDAADRLMSISDAQGSNSVFSASYGRDNANQLTSDSSATSTIGSYAYNALNQVCYAGSSNQTACSSPPTGSTPYSYDAGDNLTQNGAAQQAFNGADEVCWTGATAGSCASPPPGATTYTYDPRGNRTSATPAAGGAVTLSYDQGNRLTGYGTSATYTYNADGLRMSKTVSGATSQFVWDAAAAVPLVLKDGTTAYIYGPAGQPLEQISGSTVLWLHHDQLGSTRLVTDTSGATQATYTYEPYGKLIASTGPANTALRFAAQYQDAESGLSYMRARYYDPLTGQFISVDPVGAQTREPYGYVYGNPLNATDPTGLACLQFWDPSKCHNWLTDQVTKISASHTIGVCGEASAAGFGVGVNVSLCGVVRFNGAMPVAFGTTESFGAGASVGLGVTGLAGVQVSNATHLTDLRGWFVNFSASGGAGLAGGGGVFAGPGPDCQTPVVAGGFVGFGYGLGVSGQVGASYTFVQSWLGN